MKYLSHILTIGLILCACNNQESAHKEDRNFIKTETAEEKTKRMQWWRDAGFGMFIHWGLYSIPAGQYGEDKNHAEWIQETANIPVKEYEQYAAQFNPVNYDAKQWVRMAKDAGMKYIVITSKHHDGFCLWNSDISDYDMQRTPYQKDLLMDLAEECKKEGIILCFYYSIMDWNHPQAQGINHPDYNHGTGPNPEFSSYVKNYMYPQLKELLTQYGEIGVMWFDGEWITEWTEEQGKELYNLLRNIQPNLIINNRVGKGRQGMEGMNAYDDAAGDFGTPEQEILEGTSTLDWESCMTMNDHWGYNQFDHNFKSTESLIHNLVDIAAKGGNYLLNVGPTADGQFPEESILRLKEIGDWMDINGEIIHNSRKCDQYQDSDHTYYIQNEAGTTLYAVLTAWPGQSIHLQYANPEANSEVHLLGYKKQLTWEAQKAGGILIHLPETWQEEAQRTVKHAFVIKMKGKQAKVAAAPELSSGGKVTKHKSLFSNSAQIELGSENDGAQIYYTLDNSEPSRESMRYTGAIEIVNSTTIRAITAEDNHISSRETKVEFIKTEAFAGVHIHNAYSEKYAAMGDLTVADGVFGSKDNYLENWLGFEGIDFNITIDLGNIKPVKTVKANFLENIKSWIFLPETIKVALSEDGKNFNPVKTLEIEKAVAKNKAKSQLFVIEVPETAARYVQIIAKNAGVCPEWHIGAGSPAWLFVDEVVVE